MAVRITQGTGSASVATEQIGSVHYQQIKVMDGRTGSTVGMRVNSDGSINASIMGVPQVSFGNASIIAVVPGSIIAIVQGSVVAAGNQSVSGTVGASIIGMAPVAAGQGVGINGDGVNQMSQNLTNGSFTLDPIGSAGYVFNGSTWDQQRGNSSIGTLVNTGTSSVITTNVGSVVTVFQSSSIIARVTGSVTTIAQGSIISLNIGSIITTNIGSVITRSQDSSILAVPVGSTIAVIQNASIAGTYAEDAAHTTGDRGLLALHVRNDLLSSVTSANGDYSPHVVGPAGEQVTVNAPFTKWVQGTADLRGNAGTSVVVIAAGGPSVFTYVTSAQIVNLGSASVLVTFAGTGSTLGYTIAPAGGGSNMVFPNALKTPQNAPFAASISAQASVFVSAQGFTAGI